MNMGILLVEDNAVDSELFTEAFSDVCKCRPPITVVTDGDAALRVLHTLTKKPAFVLLDLNLPKMSGLDVLKEIRQDDDPAINLMPVIILTNSKTAHDVELAYKHKCNAFVRKPLGYPKLVELAQKLNQFWCHCAILPNRDTPIPPSF